MWKAGPGNASLSSASAPAVCGPTSWGDVPPPVSTARRPAPASLNASAGVPGARPGTAAGGDQGGAAPAVGAPAASAAAASAAAAGSRVGRGAARTDMGGSRVGGATGPCSLRPRREVAVSRRWIRATPAPGAGGSGGEVELLDDLVAVAAAEGEDLAAAEAAHHRDARVGRAPARVGDEPDERDHGVVDRVRRLDVRLEVVPEVVDLVEPAADPAVALVAGALVEQAEHRLRHDLGIHLGQHRVEIAVRPGGVEAPDRVDVLVHHGRPPVLHRVRRAKPPAFDAVSECGAGRRPVSAVGGGG